MTTRLSCLGGAFLLSWGHALLITVSKVSGLGEHFGERKTTPSVFVRPHDRFLPRSSGPSRRDLSSPQSTQEQPRGKKAIIIWPQQSALDRKPSSPRGMVERRHRELWETWVGATLHPGWDGCTSSAFASSPAHGGVSSQCLTSPGPAPSSLSQLWALQHIVSRLGLHSLCVFVSRGEWAG